MTHKSGSILSQSECTFTLNINDQIPDNTKLVAIPSKCAMHEADSITILSHSDGSCYAEISIDYYTKKMTIKLTHVSFLQSTLSPYDDMFGFANGIKSVIQYKINGNLEQEKIEMITRIQCKTYNDCALDKLRKLLPNLTISDARLHIFKQVIKLLNTRDSNESQELTCMNDDDSAEIECLEDEDRCKFDHSKDVSSNKGCASEDSVIQYDIEYRFNVIEEIANYGIDNSANALKCFYLCKKDYCNSKDNFIKVDALLNSFALVSLSNKNNQNTNHRQPAAQTNHKQSYKAKSDGVSVFISFYYRSIINFFLLIFNFIEWKILVEF